MAGLPPGRARSPSRPRAACWTTSAAAGAVQLDVRMHPVAITNDPQVGEPVGPAHDRRPRRLDPGGRSGSGDGGRHRHRRGREPSGPRLEVWHNPGEIAGNGVDDDGNGLVNDVTGWDFCHGDASVYDAGDANGDGEADDMHGTHVAGSIAARRDNGVGVAGVADNARIMPVKFIGPDGGYTSDAVEAIHYAVVKGARVINASFGSTEYAPALCDAIAEAGADGRGVRGRRRERRDRQRRLRLLAGQLPRDVAPLGRRHHAVRRPRLVLEPRPGAGGPGRSRQSRAEHPARERVRLPQRDLDGRAARHRGGGRRAGREPGPGSLAGGHGDRGRGRPRGVTGDDHRDRSPR